MGIHNIHQKNIAIFDDTLDYIDNTPALTEAVQATQARTVCYDPKPRPALHPIPTNPATPPEHTAWEVSTWRSFEAARRLQEQYGSDQSICVLNFASALNPGGGVTRGSSAQEEALCRCSTLYPCLTTDACMKQFYQFHRARHDARYTDACIYTPGIRVIKTDTSSPERLPPEQWLTVNVITCAAPNLRPRPNNAMNPGSDQAAVMSPEELLRLHKSRAQKILTVAAENGNTIVVLGAFGCGAFKNDPYVVAQAYSEVAPAFDGHFVAIHFAVYCPPSNQTNYRAFQRAFKKRPSC